MRKIRLGDGLTTKRVDVGQVNQIHFALGRNRKSIRFFGMPLDGVKRIRGGVRPNWRYTEQELSPDRQMNGSRHLKNNDLRNVVCDNLGQLPNNKSTVRGDSSKTISINSHVTDTGCILERRRRQLK